MRYITIPTPVTLVNWINGAPFIDESGRPMGPISFYRMLAMWFFDSEHMGAGSAQILTLVRLHAAFKDAAPGDEVAVEDADWEKLEKVRQTQRFPSAAAQLAEYFNAIGAAGSAGRPSLLKKKLGG